ncbi:MAG: FtsQ-type POTRA domain-containing protein [Methylibium sp.]|uniref:cell division protein FtsQ/DivIB n=1 Tax=Methylibium sp. TaxID=2067992 RepID=UPI0017F7AE93|nr:cell division protein FtsQ/DivIB [Methylibium sp.]MBA3598902.1 FtsQ-type POTRA domain-containing protein [Methylibium sp.]
MARRLRNPRPTDQPEAPPWDVRAMNLAAALLFAVAALVFAGLLLTWLLRLPHFNLSAIELRGDFTRNSAATIRANAAPRLAGNLFSIDLAQTQAAFEAVPWVRRASVQRVWPDRLSVTLEEHRPAAWWQAGEGQDNRGQDKLVNVQGEVFEANPGDVEDEGLPVLRGPEGSAAEVLAMQRRLLPVFAALDTRIDRLRLSARGSWRVLLDSGAEVELGRGSEDEVVARVQVFGSTLPRLIARYERPLEYADLRHADGYALRLKGVGTVVPALMKK